MDYRRLSQLQNSQGQNSLDKKRHPKAIQEEMQKTKRQEELDKKAEVDLKGKTIIDSVEH